MTLSAGRRRLAVVSIVVAAMALLALVAFFLTRDADGPGGAAGVEETRPVEVRGAPLPTLPDLGPDAAVGARMPEVRGASFDGRAVVIAADGRPKVIVFLAHWCPHCQREVPALAAWLRRGRLPPGVELYGVSTAVRPEAPNYPPSDWLRREGWPAPVVADSADGRTAAAFGLSGFPFFVFVNVRGEVVGRHAAEISMPELEARIATLVR